MTPNRTKHQDLIKEIKEFYKKPDNICGGNLHIVLDDYNLEDHFVEFCLKRAKEDNDPKGVEICKELLKLSFLERNRLFRGRFGKF
jgi:hypothetical protein